jgi:small GTP-binding protein
MESRKICILGDFAVGKTSLVQRFVKNQFSDKYLTTLGVKVDTKEVMLDAGRGLKLAIWDVAGTDAPTQLFLRYTRGAAGYLLVADRTRPETLDACATLREAVSGAMRPLPYVYLGNKSDLTDRCQLSRAMAQARLPDAIDWLDTSALTGDNVELAFRRLTEGILGNPAPGDQH